MQLKICVIDTFYMDFIESLRTISYAKPNTYYNELTDVLSHEFGTGQAYSRNLRQLGWDVTDIVANHHGLQHKWAFEFGASGTLEQILLAQIEYYKPDVLFFQDLSFLSAGTLHQLRQKYLLAGQCSCPMPPRENVAAFHILFTSFPHYVDQFKSLGVHAEYLPLAFDATLLKQLRERERIYDCMFIGGVGAPSHWKYGMKVLNAVAENIETFLWWGYGQECLPPQSALRQKYQNSAWGLDMLTILRQSKMAIARHGEVAEGYSNNMKIYETCGTGAMLLTETSRNLGDLFTEDEVVSYSDPEDLIKKIRYYLAHDTERMRIAAAGQARCLRDHTYEVRMRTISDALTLCLQGKSEYAIQQ